MNLLLPGIAALQNLAPALIQASLTSSALVILLYPASEGVYFHKSVIISHIRAICLRLSPLRSGCGRSASFLG
jgi:hypothetical protein